MISWSKIFYILQKEILLLLKDSKMRFMMVGPPVIQLLIFSYAATLELNHISLAVVNHDQGLVVKEFLYSLSATPFIDKIYYAYEADLPNLLDNQKVIAALVIPETFSQSYEQSINAEMQLILDGRKANASQLCLKYLQSVIDQSFTSLISPTIQLRYWYNPNLSSLWTTIPALVVIIAMLMGLLISGLSIAREREEGTLEALLVSPISNYELIIAKTIPALCIGVFQSCLMTFFGTFFLGVPLRGSLLALILLCACFVYSVAGLGLSISSFAKNQQQAIIGVFLVMVPSVTLSGYAAPIENMPLWMQMLSHVNPLRYALLGSRAIFLKEASFLQLIPSCVILMMMGTLSLQLAVSFFQYHRKN